MADTTREGDAGGGCCGGRCDCICEPLRKLRSKVANPLGVSQLILYFSSVFWGLLVAVPVGIVLRNFQGRCVLFAQFVWDFYTIWPWSEGSCDFVLYFSIAGCIVYGVLMSVFTLIVVLPKTDSSARFYRNVRSIQAINSTFILYGINPVFQFINFLMVCLTLCSAVIVSVGFAHFCNSFENTRKAAGSPTSCSKTGKEFWSDFNIVGGGDQGVDGDNFYVALTVASIASWILFVVWVLQLVLNFSVSCRGCSCLRAEEKQKAGSRSQQEAERRSRMATPSASPGGRLHPHMVQHMPPPGQYQQYRPHPQAYPQYPQHQYQPQPYPQHQYPPQQYPIRHPPPQQYPMQPQRGYPPQGVMLPSKGGSLSSSSQA